MFKAVSAKTDFPALEREILAFWQEHDIFRKSVEARDARDQYVFYDGPPFATGLPHYGHLLAGTIKDIVPRYWTMQGKRVERRFGWDCHGLPIENEAAKDLKTNEGLDLSGKYEIEAYGIDRFNEYCRSIVLKYTAEWQAIVTRMGRWVDFENGYRTMDRDYMETLWWVFKQLWDKGLIYQGYRVMPFSWKLSTPLSNFEANLNYQDVQDPAITVKFKALNETDTYFLAWTTTPWTLPSNLGLAVGLDIDYVAASSAGDAGIYILAEARLGYLSQLTKTEWTVRDRFKGAALLDRRYEPLFPYFATLADQGAFRVIPSDHVTTEDGTGIVHMAPAFGEEDFRACEAAAMPFVDPVDMEGRFTEPVTEVRGMNVKEADKHLIKMLKSEGKLLHQGTVQHAYPFCWRSNTPLIYKAIRAWFVKVESIKTDLIENNQKIHWVPDFVGTKRFGNWLENARDWNISRNRYWGTPLPIWQHEESGDFIAIGSVAELETLSGEKVGDLHRHFIDPVTITKDGKTYTRIAEVFDCWYESGGMPYAQHHYPFENKEFVETHFPADFIAEGLDQTRGWFYTLNVLSTALFNQPAFHNVVVNGLILAEDGQKMSKQKKNYPDPLIVIETYGADCLRSYLINSPVVRAEPLRFQEAGITQIYRTLLSPLWNAYAFFVTYAELDQYQPSARLTGSTNELDRWIISRFHSMVATVTEHMTNNHLFAVIPELQNFVDQLTNWYIRRSRRRFWRAENDTDKKKAYDTLYFVLLEFAKVMAPFMPFLCESIYLNLAGDGGHPESVHLCDYPKPDSDLIDDVLESEMALIKNVVELGRSLRVSHSLKVRQPLQAISVMVDPTQRAAIERLGDIVMDELNVKEIQVLNDETTLTRLSARPNLKLLGPRLGQAMKVLNPAIRTLSHAEISAFLQNGRMMLAGQELTGEDLLIDREQREDMIVVSGDGVTIGLDTHLTPELLVEGDARELVNRVQNLRKEADFNVADRIYLDISGGDWLAGCLTAFGDYIERETLALCLSGSAFDAEIEKEWEVNGKPVRFRLARATGIA